MDSRSLYTLVVFIENKLNFKFMKYIILPLYRFIVFLYVVTIGYPIAIFIIFLWGFWDFKWKEKYNSFLNMNFIEEEKNSYESINRDSYWAYKTPLDYLLNKKTFYSKKEKNDIQ